MRFWLLTIAFLSASLVASCSSETKPDTPVETFKTYVTAVKLKDTTKMKMLLSLESIKMHEQEARAQSVTLDDVVQRDPLISDAQKVVEFRNEKIEGEAATLEVKDSFGSWTSIPFVREADGWKIDKKGFADRLQQDVEQDTQQMDDFINQGKQTPQL
jgi:hypothetical protein